MTTGDEKICPRCAETIKAAAKVCRFCGHEFEAPAPKPLKVSLDDGSEKKKAGGGCAKYIGGFVAVVALIAIIGSLSDNNGSSNNSSSGSSTLAAAKTCKSDWTVCTDNGDLVNNWSGWSNVEAACQVTGEEAAKYGTPKWPWLPFSSYLKGNNYVTDGIATAIEKDAQFQNGFGAMVHSEAMRRYDLRSSKVLDVNIIPH